MTVKALGQASIKKTPSWLTEAGGLSESGSNILARMLFWSDVKVILVVSNMVPPTFSLIQSVILTQFISIGNLGRP